MALATVEMTGGEPMDLLTRREAADLLRISLPTLDRLARQNKLPAIKIGKSVRYKKASLLATIDELEAAPAGE